MRTAPGGACNAIVIGASAGGIEVLAQLLPALPHGVPLAVFIVLHQRRERSSQLVEVLRRGCRLELMEAADKETVVPGVVYVAPADYHLLIEKGPQLALSADEPVHLCRPSIDVLFESAAEIYGARLLGIVLSGANEDGAQGLAAVSCRGGTAIVQDPQSAYADTMPRAALRGVPGARALAVADIAAMLAALGQASRAFTE
ncbi:MAG TPA: chemotaxis protein CheB [Steroidobacteraceae bacterium]|nr:chemotaxis protein CheB [Steroidobacteraceae bacterium]